MPPKVFKPANNKPINEKLNRLESVREKISEIKAEEDEVIAEIRNGFVSSVAVFIDMVDSTKFKVENSTTPEKWILRVNQFSEIIKEFVEKSNGKVVKYIGDEVMAVFDQKTQINDALSLISRIQEIEESISEITGVKTQVKIAVDYGSVFLLKYDGHNELDPQGTPIDRCARIGKYTAPGTVLASYDFVSKCAFPNHWAKLGVFSMKGLEKQAIYQYGSQTIDIKAKIEVVEEEYNSLKSQLETQAEEIEDLKLEKTQLVSTITELQNQITEIGERPVIETSFEEDEGEDEQKKEWDEIKRSNQEVLKLIKASGVPLSEYGRFLFLKMRGEGQLFDSFSGHTFRSAIENDLVRETSDNYFVLDMANKEIKS
jgi:class 3 adenylate cyclase